VEQNPAISSSTQDAVKKVAKQGIPVVSVNDVQQAAEKQGVPKAEAEAVADDYGDAQLQGLKRAIGAVGIFALLSFWFTRGLPGRAPAAPERPTEPVAVASPP
jgi:ABC-type sugar transport system substrate-binding protein